MSESIKVFIFCISATILLNSLAGPYVYAQSCPDLKNLALVNGRIHIMDAEDTIVSSVLIRHGRFAEINTSHDMNDACTDIIDLEGKTVIPGLIDNHVHFVRMGNRPGVDMRELESTYTIPEALYALAKKSLSVPEGELITTIGGFRHWQWKENRFPTIVELDRTVPDHPVYISEFGFGPGQTNTMARDMLGELGVAVSDAGVIAQGDDTARAYEVLASSLTDEDRRAQLKNIIQWANRVGLTAVMDMSGTVPGVGFLDQRVGYEPITSLDRDNALNLRVRLYFPALDEDGGLSQLQGRLDNTFHHFGSDMLKLIGIGEWSVGRSLFNEQPLGAAAAEAQRRIAERGWTYHQHLHTPAEIDAHLDIWETLDKEYDLSTLRWTAGHMSGATPELIARVVDMGLGIGAHGQPYTARGRGGPPWRTLYQSGAAAVAAGSDGARISPMNPWSIIYYMVTGKNSAGEWVNQEQTLSRFQAVRLYSSSDQGWFTKEDNSLGGIAGGRYGDLAVLGEDVFDEDLVSDEHIRTMHSILTIVGGRIVYSDGSLTTQTIQ